MSFPLKLNTGRQNSNFIAAIFTIILGLGVASCFIGRMDISNNDIWHALWRAPMLLWAWLFGDDIAMTGAERVLLLVRFPRVIMAMLVGAGLSVSGTVYQGLFRNPLVSPDILGVAAGCTFGAALGFLVPHSSFLTIQLLSFVMGLLAVGLALCMARLVRSSSLLVLVLTGVITGSLFHSFFMIVKTVADPLGELPAIVFWVMGSLSGAGWSACLKLFPVLVGGYTLFHVLRYRLNVLSLGDETARSLGVNPNGIRLCLIAVSSLIIAVCVSLCGQIAWIGLVIPHMVRTFAGPNHLFLVPGTALLGAGFLVLADDLARSLFPAELPLGVLTSLIGAPLFAWLLYQNKNKGWL